jgi:hypothetical protein
VLEPNSHPAAGPFQKALFDDGIPATTLTSADVRKEYEKLIGRGVVFRTRPTQMGPVTVAVFEDTCGNLIQMHQKTSTRS